MGFVIVLVIAITAYKLIRGKDKSADNIENATKTSNEQTVLGQNNQDSSPLPTELAQNLPQNVSAITLSPVSGQDGSATVLTVADGEELVLAIEANLADPGDKFYFAWLSSNSSNQNLQLLGKLEEKEGKYILPASAKGPLSNYQKLVITLESNEDNKPETVVLEGKLTS